MGRIGCLLGNVHNIIIITIRQVYPYFSLCVSVIGCKLGMLDLDLGLSTCSCLCFSLPCLPQGMISSHVLRRCKTAGVSFLVSADVPDLTSSCRCSKQGHTEGATVWEWNTFSLPGWHISKVTPTRST